MAWFVAAPLCAAPRRPTGHFHVVARDDGATLDFLTAGAGPIGSRQLASRVGEDDFDAAVGRIRTRRPRRRLEAILHGAPTPWYLADPIPFARSASLRR